MQKVLMRRWAIALTGSNPVNLYHQTKTFYKVIALCIVEDLRYLSSVDNYRLRSRIRQKKKKNTMQRKRGICRNAQYHFTESFL